MQKKCRKSVEKYRKSVENILKQKNIEKVQKKFRKKCRKSVEKVQKSVDFFFKGVGKQNIENLPNSLEKMLTYKILCNHKVAISYHYQM